MLRDKGVFMLQLMIKIRDMKPGEISNNVRINLGSEAVSKITEIILEQYKKVQPPIDGILIHVDVNVVVNEVIGTMNK
jgi:hypothetical protein